MKQWNILSLSPIRPSRIRGTLLAGGLPAALPLEIRTLPAGTLPSLLAESIADAHILIGDYSFHIPINDRLLSYAANLKFIQQPSAGLNTIDLKACHTRGIQVASAASANCEAVAEHTLMLALALLKNVFQAHQAVASGQWPQFHLGNRELKGMTWGIVGMGKIGRELALRLIPFGTRVVYCDLVKPADLQNASPLSLDTLLEESDIVSLHIPLTKETENLIDHRRIFKMKEGSFLINVARGGVVDEDALAERLQKDLGGAAFDVFSQEPLPMTSALRSCRNVLFTPHTAGVTQEARQRILRQVIGNMIRFIAGQTPIDLVRGGTAT